LKNWTSALKKVKTHLKNKVINPDEALGLINEIEFQERTENILGWSKYYFPDKFDQPFCNNFHNYLVEIRNITRTNTLAPRGYAKTTIECFAIPIYQALNEPDTFRHYLNIQDTSTKAISVNLTIREEIENNELLKRDYGELVNDEKWTEKQFVLSNGVVFTAIGAGDSVRGINYRNVRPDFILIDDLYNEDDIYSPDRVLKKNRWFWSSIYKSLAKKESACIHIQGTAIRQNDLMHTLPTDLWKTAKFQAIIDYDKKIVLWPEVETFEKLMEDKKQMGSVIFSREMQNDTHDDETSLIKLSYITYYDKLPDKVNKWSWSWDTAIKEEAQNDYSVGTLWAQCEDGYYLVYMYRTKEDFPKLEKSLENLFLSRPASEVLVEDKSSGQQLVQVFRRKTSIPVIAMRPGKDMGLKKIERLGYVAGLFESGNVKFPKDSPWVMDVVDELINFGTANHDDIVDSITQYLSKRLGHRRPRITIC